MLPILDAKTTAVGLGVVFPACMYTVIVMSAQGYS